jgi:hypothetical protein
MMTPRWLRISVAALLFLSAVENLRKGALEWGPLLCLGLMLLVGVDRRQGESLTSYYKTPRAVVASLFGVCAMVGILHNIYILAVH